jgi:hypothetical protein
VPATCGLNYTLVTDLRTISSTAGRSDGNAANGSAANGSASANSSAVNVKIGDGLSIAFETPANAILEQGARPQVELYARECAETIAPQCMSAADVKAMLDRYNQDTKPGVGTVDVYAISHDIIVSALLIAFEEEYDLRYGDAGATCPADYNAIAFPERYEPGCRSEQTLAELAIKHMDRLDDITGGQGRTNVERREILQTGLIQGSDVAFVLWREMRGARRPDVSLYAEQPVARRAKLLASYRTALRDTLRATPPPFEFLKPSLKVWRLFTLNP